MKALALWILRTYKRWLSPMFPPSCRYVPTCSEYAMEAVEKFGALRGGWMAMGRLLRCHPFVKGRYDPVPEAPSETSGAEQFAEKLCFWVAQRLTAAIRPLSCVGLHPLTST